MIDRLRRNTALPATRERANCHGRFGIHGDAQGFGFRVSRSVHIGDSFENGVGFTDFFLGLALATVIG